MLAVAVSLTHSHERLLPRYTYNHPALLSLLAVLLSACAHNHAIDIYQAITQSPTIQPMLAAVI